MVGPKTKKRKQSGSSSGTAPEVEVEVDSMSTYEMMASMKVSIQKDLQKDIDAMKAELKKLKPVHKQFVRDRDLSLINEFIAFISHIHGTGVQWKYVKAYNTGKFNKLVGNVDFEADCQEFLSSDPVDPSPSLKLTSDLCALFNNLCNTRNSLMHYEEPEDCILEVQKFERKHGDLLHKCSEEVQFCVPRIGAMARHFVGPYRLKRLACHCVRRFLHYKGMLSFSVNSDTLFVNFLSIRTFFLSIRILSINSDVSIWTLFSCSASFPRPFVEEFDRYDFFMFGLKH